MGKRDGTEMYQKVFRIVRNILNYVDPERLDPGKPGGSPIDEYEMEVAPIVSFVIRHRQSLESYIDSLSGEIDRVWTEHFDRECPGSKEIAKQIAMEISRL